MKQNCYTPELLQKRLQTLHARLDENKAAIAEQWHTLFAPPAESGGKLQYWMSQADRAAETIQRNHQPLDTQEQTQTINREEGLSGRGYAEDA